MNYIYFGNEKDLNIGNGKTVSAVKQVLEEHLLLEKKIFSNIQLNNIDYVQLKPQNIGDVLKQENSIVLLDEIHAIIHKNHRVSETCKKHQVRGLCYKLAQFFRQVRKRNITTVSTAQLLYDCHVQYRNLMQMGILCEKYHLIDAQLKKCTKDICTDYTEHYIHTYNIQTHEEEYYNPQRYFDMYNSEEIVEGWLYEQE